MTKEDSEKKDAQRRSEAQLAFECAVCEKAYDHPGMCQACHILLKKRGG